MTTPWRSVLNKGSSYVATGLDKMLQLDILGIVVGSYRLIFGNLPVLIRTLSTSLILSVIGALTLAVAFGLDRGAVDPEAVVPGLEDLQTLPPEEQVAATVTALVANGIFENLLLALFLLVLAVPFAVIWHRVSQNGVASLQPEDLRYRFGPREIRSLQMRLAIIGMFLLAVMGGELVIQFLGPSLGLPQIVILLAMATLVVLLAARALRASLILPAIATDRRLTLAEARELGRGIGGEILMIAILIHLPYLLILPFVGVLSSQLAGLMSLTMTQSIVSMMVGGFMALLADALFVAAMSKIYLDRVNRKPPAAIGPQ